MISNYLIVRTHSIHTIYKIINSKIIIINQKNCSINSKTVCLEDWLISLLYYEHVRISSHNKQ